jgi:hypothetical protein
LKLSDRKFDEEHEGKSEEGEPPDKIPEELRERETGDVETEKQSLSERARDIGLGRPFIQKVPGEREETEREERRHEQQEGEKKYSLAHNGERHRIDSKNENAEDAEGREREETKSDY